MRSLFVRIFVSVFVAMLLAGSGFALVYAIETPSDPRHRGRLFVEDTLRVRGEWMLARIAPDPSVIDAELDDLARRTNARIHLFLDDGRVIGPGAPSATSRTLVATVRRTGEAAHARIESPPAFFEAVRIDGAVVSAEFPSHPRPPSIFGALETLPIRIAIVILAIAIVASLLARYLTKPIRVLRAATDRLARGDVHVRVADEVAFAPEEFALLGRDFDRMAERLATLLESKERLLRDVSHELRSPLARLAVALGLARKRAGDGPNPELDRIERESERLSELVGHVLTLARLADDAPIVDEAVELDPLVDAIVTDADYEASVRGTRVVREGLSAATVTGSPEALRWAIENVVRNAVAYSPKDAPVVVRVTSDESMVRIAVRDRGPGVPSDALESIFRPFYRIGTDRDRRTGGAGVGLAITLRVAERSGGRAFATLAAGGGLEVTIELPRRVEGDRPVG